MRAPTQPDRGPGPRPDGPVLLSLADSNARARPLRSCTAAARERVREHVSAAVAAWWSAWARADRGDARGMRCDSLQDALAAGPVTRSTRWLPLGQASPGVWWTTAPERRDAEKQHVETDDVVGALHVGLFGDAPRALGRATPPSPSAAPARSLAREVAELAWNDLVERLGVALGAPRLDGPDAQRDADPARAWSGDAVVTLRWFDRELVLRVSGAVVARAARTAAGAAVAAPASRTLTPILTALCDRELRVEVQLRPMELDVGTLVAMQAGAVLCTSHPLHAPLAVELEGAAARPRSALWAAGLGTIRGHRAIELIPHVPADTPRPAHGAPAADDAPPAGNGRVR